MRLTRVKEKVHLNHRHAVAISAIEVDRILVATGRLPNVESLTLEATGIKSTKKGVTVDEYQRTSNKPVYAAGDISGQEKFTHAA
ncbi:FAD-dependent oxidoreductase [Pelagicoccus sp. SDUM812002]|uniref:FAD-dependent oxidoreductase n=1 Tax=Pelagicoccus sp. SDUM812002 TaxID=3041266 RepID=UPI00280F9B16|nr:FAD-dependent oxidoreductase [Pelagicoccus sp. SDUM812002]MDQ8187818.1 FAD-dependent oxidoreductase [Pelagicoccus sp. SDUM812002]